VLTNLAAAQLHGLDRPTDRHVDGALQPVGWPREQVSLSRRVALTLSAHVVRTILYRLQVDYGLVLLSRTVRVSLHPHTRFLLRAANDRIQSLRPSLYLRVLICPLRHGATIILLDDLGCLLTSRRFSLFFAGGAAVGLLAFLVGLGLLRGFVCDLLEQVLV